MVADGIREDKGDAGQRHTAAEEKPPPEAMMLMEQVVGRENLRDKERAWKSAMNGRGPWWNAGASHMNACVTTSWLEARGFLTLLQQHRALEYSA